MATRKQSEPLKSTVTPEPDAGQNGGGCTIPDAIEQFDTPAAPGGQDGTHPGSQGYEPPSTITIEVGSAGWYSGARPYEDLAAYNTRLDTVADTFGDLGWLLGTKPKA